MKLGLCCFGSVSLGDKPREYACAGNIEEAMRLEAQGKALENVVEREIETLGLQSNMKVLDAGCGTGAVTRKIALKVYPEEACGVDIDPLFINEARKLTKDQNIKNIKFELGDIDNLKYENATFDLSYCRLVLMHVKNPVKTVAELKRVTKRGGLVAASDNDDGTMLCFPQAPKFLELWSKFGQRVKARGEDRYIGRKLFSIFSKAGLSRISIYLFPSFATQQTPEILKMYISVPVQVLQQEKDAMIQEGLITAKDYEEAMQEIQLILKHPGAFVMGLSFLAVGKVP